MDGGWGAGAYSRGAWDRAWWTPESLETAAVGDGFATQAALGVSCTGDAIASDSTVTQAQMAVGVVAAVTATAADTPSVAIQFDVVEAFVVGDGVTAQQTCNVGVVEGASVTDTNITHQHIQPNGGQSWTPESAVGGQVWVPIVPTGADSWDDLS